MRLLLLFSISLLLPVWQTACAQSADVFFNRGAQAYITNDIPEALKSVETGLKQYPDDVKLKKLYELLKQQNQQQSQNNQSQQNRNQQSQQNQSQPQQNQQRQQNQQQQPQPSQQNQTAQNQSGQKNAGPQNQPPPQPANGNQAAEKQENQQGQGQPVAAGQMSPEAAKRLLDAQKGDEQFLQLKPQTPPSQDQRPIKDW
ncbi:MAG TPA: hypothetical protein VMA35_04730 [Candidatus Sulfopaludibacter sp.]|nr:hypothetical protein [Candidatus Sulfopaludibacter sp.]